MRIVSTLGLLLVSLAAVRAECGKGVKCGEGSPCCREGWCDSKASFCMAGYCDPVHSFSPNSCWPRPACIDQSYTFGGGGFAPSPIRWTLAKSFNGDPNTADWIREFEPDHTDVNPATGGMVLYMTRAPGEQKGFGATVSSTRWVEYGKVTARLKSASHGKGPVSAFILKGSEGDEIDIAEIVGLERDRIQTNFYYDGIEDYTHMVRSPELAHTDQAYYDYGVDWKPDSITWLINGQPIRVLRKADTWDSKLKVFKFPSRPARIQFSVWDGGNSGKEGTMKWAGTPTEWDKFARFEMEIAQVSVECYYKGNSTFQIQQQQQQQQQQSPVNVNTPKIESVPAKQVKALADVSHQTVQASNAQMPQTVIVETTTAPAASATQPTPAAQQNVQIPASLFMAANNGGGQPVQQARQPVTPAAQVQTTGTVPTAAPVPQAVTVQQTASTAVTPQAAQATAPAPAVAPTPTPMPAEQPKAPPTAASPAQVPPAQQPSPATQTTPPVKQTPAPAAPEAQQSPQDKPHDPSFTRIAADESPPQGNSSKGASAVLPSGDGDSEVHPASPNAADPASGTEADPSILRGKGSRQVQPNDSDQIDNSGNSSGNNERDGRTPGFKNGKFIGGPPARVPASPSVPDTQVGKLGAGASKSKSVRPGMSTMLHPLSWPDVDVAINAAAAASNDDITIHATHPLLLRIVIFTTFLLTSF